MNLKKCRNGHTYDPSITPECPECAQMYGKTVPLKGGTVQGGDDYGKTVPLYKPTEPVNFERDEKHWADVDRHGDVPFISDDYKPTQPVMPGFRDHGRQMENPGAAGVIAPVTGWLVCVEGPSKGKDYKIHPEYNRIGRGSTMDICILGDETISRENHAMIAYDSLERTFYFAPATGGSIVRVNGKAVLGNVELNAHDRITIGKSQFIFIPFCGEKFEWE